MDDSCSFFNILIKPILIIYVMLIHANLFGVLLLFLEFFEHFLFMIVFKNYKVFLACRGIARTTNSVTRYTALPNLDIFPLDLF